MIERIAFDYFRGFEKLELLDIKPITLISGKNNAGKSSILEGILHLNLSRRSTDFEVLFLLPILQLYGNLHFIKWMCGTLCKFLSHFPAYQPH